jgi:hypothetical protein
MNDFAPQFIDITEVYRLRIANLVEKHIQDNRAFRERLNPTEVINSMTQSMREKFTLPQFMAIEDRDLKRRIGQRMATEGLRGLLSDLSPEQLKAFNDGVAGR